MSADESDLAADPGELEEAARRSGPLESLFTEAIRRAASLGFSSFFLTEEALRRAFNDSVPREWVDYVSRQGEGVRTELFDALAKQFGEWLREIDLVEILGEVLRGHDISVRLDLSAERRAEEGEASRRSTLEVISRRR